MMSRVTHEVTGSQPLGEIIFELGGPAPFRRFHVYLFSN